MHVRTTSAMAMAMAMAMALMRAPVRADMPTIYDYQFDGTTTYCYDMNQGLNVQNLDYTYTAQKAMGSACPVILNIKRTSTGTLLVNQDVEFELKADTNFDSDNAFHMKSLLSTLNDGKGMPIQIPHANVHVCDRVSICDIFRSGSRPDHTNQEMGNFTNGEAVFRQKIAWAVPGDKIVYGHVALPPKNPYNESLHFMVFMNVTIALTNSGASSSAGDSSSSTGLMIGIIVGAVAVILGVVAACMCWRRGPENDDRFPMSPVSGVPGSKMSRVAWSNNANGTFDEFEGSMRSQFQGNPMNASSLQFHDDPAGDNAASRMMRFNGSGSHHSSRPGSAKSMNRSHHSSRGPDMQSSMHSSHRGGKPSSAYDFYSQTEDDRSSEESMGTSTSLDFGGMLGPGPASEAYSITNLGIPLDGAFPSPLNEDELAALARGDRATSATLSDLSDGLPRETEESVSAFDHLQPAAPQLHFVQSGREFSSSEVESQYVDSIRSADVDASNRSWQGELAKPAPGSAFEL